MAMVMIIGKILTGLVMLRCFSYICMTDNTILRTMKKIVMLFIACICFTHLSYAQTVELPEWVLNPNEGEFIGISLPGGDQREAECMALYSMALFNDACARLCNEYDEYSNSGSISDPNINSHVSAVRRVYNQCLSYKVMRVERLPTEEIVVSISAGNDKHDTILMLIDNSWSVENDNEKFTHNAALRVSGRSDQYVEMHNVSGQYEMVTTWSSIDGVKRYWTRRNTTVNADGYVTPEFGNYSTAGFIPDKASAVVDMKHMYLSEYFLQVLLTKMNSDKETSPYIKSFGFHDGKLYLNTDIPSFSTCIKALQPAIELLVNEWQKKGRYEKTEDYLKRVTGEKRQGYVDSLVTVFKKNYIANASSISKDRSVLSIVNYDADNEVFLIDDTEFGRLLVHVPIDEAPVFEMLFDRVRVEPKYDIINDHLGLAEATFIMPEGTEYHYSNDAGLQYAELDIDYNFAPIDLGQSITGLIDNVEKPSIIKSSLTLGNSDVDVNIPETDRNENNTFAVIIANENYDTESHVDYALNDGNTFKQYCIKTLGIPESNISFVQDATLNNIRAQVDMLTNIGNAYGGEVKFIFYYAGHGIPDESSRDAYLLPVDGYGNNVATGYKLSELYSQLSDIPSISTTVFMDACFSGADRNDRMLASARGVAIRVNSEVPDGKLVVFSAAQGNQTAMGYDEKGHGMFTYFLLKKLQDTEGNVTLGELGEYITDSVKKLSSTPKYNKPQIPTVTVGLGLNSDWRDKKL